MNKKINKVIIFLLIIVLLIAVISLYNTNIFRENISRTTPQSTSPPSLYVSNAEINKFLYEDEDLYMRLKISGEVDLREPVNINGVYGQWIGYIDMRFPDGSRAKLLKPENHEDLAAQFLQIPGKLIVDVYIPTQWYNTHYLEGSYNITIWLQGPYNNRTILYMKIFSLRMALTTTISPATWRIWGENITITITNIGDLPLILRGVAMEIPGTETVIGLINSNSSKPIIIMRGETKQWIGTPTIFSEFKEELAGKTLQINFVLDIAGAPPKRFIETTNIIFPSS